MARGTRFGARLDTIVFAACIILALVASGLPNQMREPVAQSLRNTIVAPLVGLQQNAERWRAAWLVSEQTTQQRNTVALQLAEAQGLEVENDRLRRLLGLGSRLEWGFIPAEALHTSGRSEDVLTTLTLTAGSNAGVAPYSPVVAPEGIVGLVQTVDKRLSIAILYSHPDFRVCAMSADGSAFGIVYPRLNVGAGRLTERYLLELRNVPFRAELKPETAIFSCGLGGAWPRGVLIGTVLNEVQDAESWSRTYVIRPAVNPAHVTSVMILRPNRGTQGVGNIWADAAQAQAQTRTINAAGDSLAREIARAEAAARRAALDSIRRAGFGDSLRARIDSSADSARLAPRTSPVTPRPAVTAPRPAAPAAPTVDSAAIRDAARRDSIRRDSIRRDSARDTIRIDTLPPRIP